MFLGSVSVEIRLTGLGDSLDHNGEVGARKLHSANGNPSSHRNTPVNPSLCSCSSAPAFTPNQSKAAKKDYILKLIGIFMTPGIVNVPGKQWVHGQVGPIILVHFYIISLT